MGLKLGSETVSVTNWMMSGGHGPAPEVGMGATILMWTDRHAATVIRVSKSGKTAEVQRDKATRKDANGMSETQQYTYEPDPEGAVETFRLTKKGWRKLGGGSGLRLGERSEYYDYSF